MEMSCTDMTSCVGGLCGDVNAKYKVPLESQYLLNPVRAQLVTTNFKPCTYFAEREGKKVFVKGPYPCWDDAQVAVRVAKFKRAADPDLSLVDISLVELIPDSMQDCQLGFRTKLADKREPRWFQVSASLLEREAWPLPNKLKTSGKAWTTPVRLVDWTKLSEYCHVHYTRDWAKSIYTVDPIAADEYVRHVLLSWACGCGADLAHRNFVWDPKLHRVTQVDHENWCKEWSLSDTAAGSSSTMAGSHMKKFMQSNALRWEAWFRTLQSRMGEIEIAIGPCEMIKARISKLAEGGLRCVNAILEPSARKGFKRKREIGSSSYSSNRIERSKSAKEEETMPKPVPCEIFVGKSCPKYRVGTDPWGFSINLRKSDFQKAVRRGNERQALVAFYTCFNLAVLWPTVRVAKSAQTNILNRVIICAMEDVGIANEPLVVMTVQTILPMVRGSGKRDPKVVERIIVALCRSKKTRIQSHMTHAYGKLNFDLSRSFGLSVSDELGESLRDPNWFGVIHTDPMRVWRKLGHKDGEPVSKQSILFQAYHAASVRNKRAVLQFALALVHFKLVGSIRDQRSVKTDLPPLSDDYAEIRVNNLRMDPAPESYDMHTCEGARQGVSRRSELGKHVFRTAGSKVFNIDENLNDPKLEKIYIQSKY